MREILFRAKCKNTGEWIEGYLIRPLFDESRAYIGTLFAVDDHDIDVVEVDPETLGECAGLTDKNGKSIFEWNILEFCNDDGDISTYVVRWLGSGWKVLYDGNPECYDELDDFFAKRCKIVGNVHDNPELLGVKT